MQFSSLYAGGRRDGYRRTEAETLGTHKTIFIRKDDGSIVERRIYISSNVKVRRNLYKRLDRQYGEGNWSTKSYKSSQPRREEEPGERPPGTENIVNWQDLSSVAKRRVLEEKGLVKKDRPGVKRESYRERLQRKGIIRKSTGWESTLRPRTVQEIREGRLGLPEGTTVIEGVLFTPGAQRSFKRQQEQQWRTQYMQIWEEKRAAVRSERERKARREAYREVISPFEMDVRIQEEKEQRHYRRMAKVENFINMITFGRGRSYEERSWIGRYGQVVVGGVLSFPLEAGHRVVSTIDKARIAYKYKEEIPEGAIGQELGRAGRAMPWKELYDPRTPSGAATWTFALAGGVIARGRRAAVKPELRMTDIKTKRVLIGEKTYDISIVEGRVKVGKKVYRVKGEAGEIWTPRKGDLVSELRTKYRIELLDKKGKVKEITKATGRGVGQTTRRGQKSHKVLETEILMETPKRKGQPAQKTVTLTRDIIEVKGSRGFMRGKEFSFTYGTKIVRDFGSVIFDTRAKQARLGSMGRFESGMLGEIITEGRTTQFWRTYGKGATPKIPRGARVYPGERGVFIEKSPLQRMAKSKKARTGRPPIEREQLISLEKGETVPGFERTLTGQRSHFKTVFGEMIKGIERSKIKSYPILGTATFPKQQQKDLFKSVSQQMPVTEATLRSLEKSIYTPLEKEIQQPAFKSIDKQLHRNIQRIIQRALQTPIPKPIPTPPIFTIPGPKVPGVTPMLPPPIPDLPLLGFEEPGRPGKKGKGKPRDFAYAPDLASIMLGITKKGPAPKGQLTGLELRAIPTKAPKRQKGWLKRLS